MKRIAQLEGQLREANKRAILAEANSRKFDAETDLELENDRLRSQVQEMEAFLADYGLIWVGNTAESDSDESGFSSKKFQKIAAQECCGYLSAYFELLKFKTVKLIGRKS